MASELERRIARKFMEIDRIIKNSFGFIREDMTELQKSVELMKNYLKKKDKQYEYAKKEDNKIRAEFKKEVNEFSQKIRHLNLALEKFREIEKNVVVKKELVQIEDRIRNDFREVIQDIRDEVKEIAEKIKAFETGKFKNKKTFFKRMFGKKSQSEEM